MNSKRQTIWLVSMLSLMVVLSAYYLFTDSPNQMQTASDGMQSQGQDMADAQMGDDAQGIEANEITDPDELADATGDQAAADGTDNDSSQALPGDNGQSTADAGSSDASSAGANAADSGSMDSSATDSGTADSNSADLGATDSGAAGADSADSSATDAGAADSSATGAGSSAAGSTGASSADASEAGKTDAQVLDSLKTQASSGSDYFIGMQMKRNEDLQKRSDDLLKIIDNSSADTDTVGKALSEMNALEDEQAKIDNLEAELLQDYKNAVVLPSDNDSWQVVVESDKLEKSQAVSIMDQVTKELGVQPGHVVIKYMK